MKIHHYRSDTERRVLVALITSKPVLTRVASVYQKGMFPSKWADLIASWCVQHHSLYGEAPNRAITGYMARWSAERGGRPDEEIKPVEAFLTRLNEEYECTDELNTGYLIDCAGKLFSLTRAKQAVALMEQAVEDGDVDAYEKVRSEQAKVELGQDSLCDVFGDRAALQQIFDSPSESIVRFPGDLGRFFGDTLSRDSFVSFLGPEKRSKSFWIQEVCVRALQQRRRVLVFQCGDMTQPQVIRRMACRMARRPFKARKVQYPVRLFWDDKEVKVEHEERGWDEPMTFEEVHEAFSKVKYRYTRSEKPYFQLHCSPARTMTVEKMCVVIDRLIDGGFHPDVVAVDYADILTTPKHYKESRDAVNHVWTALRGLSQTYHCLLVTATQANADSYTKSSLGMQNFSEDKRKLAHVTAVVGLNQISGEKSRGLMRLNYIVLREDEFSSDRHCHVASCLAVANPCVRSLL